MKHPIPLARAGQKGAPQDCAERIEDSHAQDADLFEPRAVSEGRVRRRLGRAILTGVSSSPGLGGNEKGAAIRPLSRLPGGTGM